MPLPLTAMFDLAKATLDVLVAEWPVDATPLPDRRYVTNGLLIWDDCESLAIMVENSYGTEADPTQELSDPMGMAFAMRGTSLGVALLRCVPDIDDNGAPPSAAEIEGAAELILTDAMAVFNTLVAAQVSGQLATCTGLAFDRWTSEGPAGGLGGGVTRFRALLL